MEAALRGALAEEGGGGNLGMVTRRVRPGGPPIPGRRQVTPPPAPQSAGRGPDADGALSRPGGGRGWGERLGRGLCPAASTGPRGQRLRPAGTKRPAGGRAGEQHSPQTGEPRCGAREPSQAGLGPSARCSPRAARPGPPGDSRARRPGQRRRRRRRSLLRPGSLLRRVSSLAGSQPPPPPPPQPRRCTGCCSPSRPGRAAGNIPESEGWWPSPAAAGGHL